MEIITKNEIMPNSEGYKLTRGVDSDLVFNDQSEVSQEESKITPRSSNSEKDITPENDQLPSRFLLSRAPHKNVLAKTRSSAKTNTQSEASLNTKSTPKNLCKNDFGVEVDTMESSLKISHVSNISKKLVTS